MTDFLGAKTKKVTTYGRRGNRVNVIPIHHDLSPVRAARALSDSPSPTTPLRRPPLGSKPSQDFGNIPQAISPIVRKEVKAVKAVVKPSKEAISIDSPRLVRRIHRPGRAVIPSTPSSYAPTPAAKPPRTMFDCVELLSTRKKRPTRLGKSHLGRYREDTEDVAEGVGRLGLRERPVSPVSAIASTSTPTRIASRAEEDSASLPSRPSSTLPLIIAVPTLEGVCSSPDVNTFDHILGIASSIGTSSTSTSSSSPLMTKAGEATYSEVFSVTSGTEGRIVMKVIPITRGAPVTQEGVDSPYQSPAEDVAKEVEITKRMSGLEGGGFVTFCGAYIVQGTYPRHLLAEWDAYADSHGTENVRPSCFDKTQEYVVIFLRDGGADLEAFTFAKKTGWVQAAGVFWQVADALARAEEWAEFEHRDLHEGQILIETYPSTHGGSDPLDPSTSGVKATIIDFGLSRLRAADEARVVFTPVPDDVLEGEGEQWDVYRAIDKRIQGDWEGYHPISNLMWLQYILNLLLLRIPSLKRPKTKFPPPAARTRTTARVIVSARARPKAVNADQERSEAAYQQLSGAKEAVNSALSTRGRKPVAGKMGSASDLMGWARGRGWFA
ncbi:uncharacterized protein MKK02DRAFT_37715 [Dioszegia hungarica]|uniref:non-specific serine/threonine protein kinase n=1 Tax=Dioszegia hungarica TaxID=4972 RepID=A0AA38H9C4_9TREE|nr:uncharacterized protein MKK02DRAFT_37715 [Dioszegia hungarica]KAI9634839.1 hypothetical protein MKK02DRAFT_37715 [Dioszegia hungarica]